MWCIWAVLIQEFPREHGRLLVVDGNVVLQTKGAVDTSGKRHPDSYTGNQLPSPTTSLPGGPTLAANDTVELYCPWCESWPLTAAAIARGNLQLQLSRLIGGVEQSDRGDEVGRTSLNSWCHT